MNEDKIKKWIEDNLIQRSEAIKITGQADSSFGEALSAGRVKPFVQFGNKRITRLYLKSDIEEYAKNKKR